MTKKLIIVAVCVICSITEVVGFFFKLNLGDNNFKCVRVQACMLTCVQVSVCTRTDYMVS